MPVERLSKKLALKYSDKLDSPEEMSKFVSEIKGKEIILETKEECIEILAYSFEVVIGKNLQLVTMAIIALLFGVLDAFIGVTMGYRFLRTMAAGYHAKTYIRCFIMSIGIIALSVALSIAVSKYLYAIIPMIILSFIFIRLYAPVGSEEKPMDTVEIITEFKRGATIRMMIITAGSLAIIAVGLYTSINMILLFGCAIISGAFVEATSITPVAMKTLITIEKIFDIKKYLVRS